MAQTLDAAAIYGNDSASTPLGLKNASGTNSVTAVGTPTNSTAYAKVVSGIKSILTANYPGDSSGLSWILNPRDLVNWAGLIDSTYQALLPPKIVSDMKQYSTTALPATEVAGAESSSIIGDFSQLLIECALAD